MFEYTEVDSLLVPMGLYTPGNCMASFDIYPSHQV